MARSALLLASVSCAHAFQGLPNAGPRVFRTRSCSPTTANLWVAKASTDSVDVATSRRRFTVGAASAASAALLTVLTPRVGCAVDVELYKNLNVEDPYLLMEPAGESFRGNKGPNLQMPEELSEEDDEPEALSARIRAKPSIDLFEDLSTVEIAASMLWAAFFYFGIFDINSKTNSVSQASGQVDAVRPSDWLKVKLGAALGESQHTWDEDYNAPVSIQAFTVSVFLLIGIAIDRSIVVGAGDVTGYFALSSAAVGCLWAGFYELGRMQQTGYRVSREDQAEMDAEWQDFMGFATDRLELRPTGRVHISEVCKAFRLEYSKYRTSEQLSDDRLKNYFRAFIRPRTGQKGKQGFFKGVALVAKTSAFGDDAAKVQWKRKEETLRELEILSAQRDAEEAARMASASAPGFTLPPSSADKQGEDAK